MSKPPIVPKFRLRMWVTGQALRWHAQGPGVHSPAPQSTAVQGRPHDKQFKN